MLAEFWVDLREKSRVRIEHADLPEDLRGAAGELVAALWTRATGAAQDALQALRDEAEAARLAAEASVATVQADLARTETALEQRTGTLLAAQVRIQELEQAQAAAGATREALEGEIARLQQEGRERDAALAQARTDFAAELEKQRAGVLGKNGDRGTLTYPGSTARAGRRLSFEARCRQTRSHPITVDR